MGYGRKITPSQTVVDKPSAFSWNVPVNVYKNQRGRFYTDFDITTFAPTGKTYYVDINTGSNTNDGLTPGTALKSVSTALGKADADVIMIAGGLYRRADSIGGAIITRNTSIKAYGQGPVVLGRHDILTWTLAAGYAKTYQANRSAVESVYDAAFPNSFGDYRKLTKKTTVDEVEAEAGTWCQVGSIVYVHALNDRIPDADLRVNVSMTIPKVSGNVTVYMEGIEIQGGFAVTNTAPTDVTKFYAKDCKFKYCETDNGFSVLGGESYLVNCEAAHNIADGFNYHIYNTVACKSVEINCVGRYNGIDNNDNGSTTHDGSKAFRLNGVYFGNTGPNVADVSDNTESWIVGCTAFDSKHPTTPQDFTFASDGGPQFTWMEGCYAFGSANALSVGSANIVYVKDNRFEGAAGTATPY